ncbi:hypothetical protein NKH18_46270 [Streptomyces sp. M10(2022)]
MAVDATSGTLTLTDRHGRCVAPGLMYDDGRATVEAEQVNALGEQQWAKAGYGRMQRSWGFPSSAGCSTGTRTRWRTAGASPTRTT